MNSFSYEVHEHVNSVLIHLTLYEFSQDQSYIDFDIKLLGTGNLLIHLSRYLDQETVIGTFSVFESSCHLVRWIV